jgi:hypothetical protein
MNCLMQYHGNLAGSTLSNYEEKKDSEPLRNFQGVHNKYRVHFNDFLIVICGNLKRKHSTSKC